MARHGQHQRHSEPLNVEQIVRAAKFDYNPFVPLRYWLRSAGTLVKEVSTGHSYSFPLQYG